MWTDVNTEAGLPLVLGAAQWLDETVWMHTTGPTKVDGRTWF